MHENANPIIREPPGAMLPLARKALMFKDPQKPLSMLLDAFCPYQGWLFQEKVMGLRYRDDRLTSS